MARTFEAPDNAQLRKIHGDYYAVDVRQGEAIDVEVRHGKGESFTTALVWRLSPLGIEIVEAPTSGLILGQSVQLLLHLGQQTLKQSGTVVSVDASHPKGSLAGIVFDRRSRKTSTESSSPVRKASRWQTHAMFYPVGCSMNPARFNDKIFFRVVDISKNGMLVETSLRNKFIISGLKLTGTIDFPNAGQIAFTAKVASSRYQAKQSGAVQLIGFEFVALSKPALKIVGSYILNFAKSDRKDPSPLRLKKEGYGTVALGEAVEFDYVKTEQEYQQVLQLRSEAFQAVEGLGVVSNAEDMADAFDGRSRIIIARFRNQVVGTMRLVFHGPNDLFEEEQYVKFPDDFPPRDQVVEASRAATHPDFRGADLFINLVRFSMLTVLQSGRKYTIQSTYGALVPVYVRIGFKDMNMRVPHPVFPGEELHLLLGEPYAVMTARTGNPFVYQMLAPHIEQFLSSSAYTQLSLVDKGRLKVWKKSAALLSMYKHGVKIKKTLQKSIRLAMKR